MTHKTRVGKHASLIAAVTMKHKIAETYDAKIIVSLRDLRDVMISRYFHVMNEKIHWQHKYIKDLDFEEGFKKSLTYFDNTQKDMPIVINYNWIKNSVDTVTTSLLKIRMFFLFETV